MGPPQVNSWAVTGHPSEILGLSPSLFSSPGNTLPEQILEDGTEYLMQGESPGLDLTLGSFRKHSVRAAWVAQLVKCLTFDLSSGLDLRVGSSGPTLGSTLGVEAYLKEKKERKKTYSDAHQVCCPVLGRTGSPGVNPTQALPREAHSLVGKRPRPGW